MTAPTGGGSQSLGSSRIAFAPGIQATRPGLSSLTPKTRLVESSPQIHNDSFIPKLWTEEPRSQSPASPGRGLSPRQRWRKFAAIKILTVGTYRLDPFQNRLLTSIG